MKRLPRSSDSIGAFDLADAVATQHGVPLKELGSKFSFDESVDRAAGDPRMLHGKRAENMFEYVVASLGKAVMIKKEDAGHITSADADLQAPDYFVVLRDGRKFLVEVKNCRLKSFDTTVTLDKDYLARLQKYAELVGHPLLIAVYWSNMGQWTINQPADIVGENGSINLTVMHAMTVNMASAFGDRVLFAKPPLICRLWADPVYPRSVDADGNASFIIQRITFHVDGVEITEYVEHQLAFYFMFHSSWVETRCEAVMTASGELEYVEFESAPSDEQRTEGQSMYSLGSLASMISNFYNWRTLSADREIERLTPALEPGQMGCGLSDDYRGKVLGLMIMEVQPNREGVVHMNSAGLHRWVAGRPKPTA